MVNFTAVQRRGSQAPGFGAVAHGALAPVDTVSARKIKTQSRLQKRCDAHGTFIQPGGDHGDDMNCSALGEAAIGAAERGRNLQPVTAVRGCCLLVESRKLGLGCKMKGSVPAVRAGRGV